MGERSLLQLRVCKSYQEPKMLPQFRWLLGSSSNNLFRHSPCKTFDSFIRSTLLYTEWKIYCFPRSHVTPLFSTRRLAINTTITILLWGFVCDHSALLGYIADDRTLHRLIGLAYPLFNGFITLYLTTQVPSDSSVSTTYRNYSIISVLGVPGSIIACLVVDWTRKNKSAFAMGGRKVTMAVSTALTGVFLFLFTTSKTTAAVLGYSCASGLTQLVAFCCPLTKYMLIPSLFVPHSQKRRKYLLLNNQFFRRTYSNRITP